MKTLLGILVGILAAIGAALLVLIVRFRRNQQRADAVWDEFQPQPLDLEPVERLTLTPLVDARTVNADLAGEAAVSYLVEADDARVLFDLGLNAQGETPSPLQRNAEALGVDLDAVDGVVISHRHLDHVGGFRAQRAHTFVLPDVLLEKAEVPVYLPEPLQHPTADVQVVERPQHVAPGIATIGPIPGALFVMGWTPEQALAVNVAGKGIVLIVGCGHQGVRRIVERAKALFDEPLYGLVGGLHFPVTGAALQRIAGGDRPPWQSLSKDDVYEVLRYLQDKGLKRIVLSPHDSCDWTLGAFKGTWGSDFDVVTVGKRIGFPRNSREEDV
jgi:7,8-dihydropterin-6-yl-methyl-4-(beta-D-ribofuranosyl)aminobenzene 5'-phosphate synthase